MLFSMVSLSGGSGVSEWLIVARAVSARLRL
jgi:hypothetical protein